MEYTPKTAVTKFDPTIDYEESYRASSVEHPIQDGFWIVWAPNAPMPPTRMHNSYEAAVETAKYVLSKVPNESVYIMEACGSFTNKPVIREV